MGAVLVEITGSGPELRAMLARQSEETGTRIAIVALANDDHKLDGALLENPAVVGFLFGPVGIAELKACMSWMIKKHHADAAHTGVDLDGYLPNLREQLATLNSEVMKLTPRKFSADWPLFQQAVFLCASHKLFAR